MTDEERIQMEWYYQKELADLTIRQLEDYVRLLNKQLVEIQAAMKAG